MDQERPASIDWSGFRDDMPVARCWAYLDHAAVAPLSGPAQQALLRWSDDSLAHGSAHYPDWMRQVRAARERAARLIGARPEEIAFVSNTTAGISLAAEGFPWQSGDNVVVPENEFPSNQYPWLNLASRGVETRRVPIEGGRVALDRIAAACDSRTRIVSVSWVAYSSGWRHDLDQLAEMVHQRGALLFLDAIQGLGVFPIDVGRTQIDFLAADGHKWLMGPEGAGIFFVRREHLDRLRPIGVGWNSVANKDFNRIELVFKDSAERFEGGSMNVAGIIALDASLALLERFGSEAIAARVLEVTDLACGKLSELGAVVTSDRTGDRRSGIVVFEMPGRNPEQARTVCFERQVLLSCRAGRLRISPHAYNDAQDIDRLIDALR